MVILFIVIPMLLLCSCGKSVSKQDAVSTDGWTERKVLDSEMPTSELLQEEIAASEKEQGEQDMSGYRFDDFKNVEITGIDISSLNDDELSVLYTQARYCQAMTDADIDTMREIVSEDMIFTHMSGRQQTREEYFADIEKGRLNYFTIGIENPVIEINGDTASITYTSVLNANAYGARGTYRMSGTHHYERRDGEWIAVNR